MGGYYVSWFNGRFQEWVINGADIVKDRNSGETWDADGQKQWFNDEFEKYMESGVYQALGEKYRKKKKKWKRKDDDGSCADADPELTFACAMCDWLCKNVLSLFGNEWDIENCI